MNEHEPTCSVLGLVHLQLVVYPLPLIGCRKTDPVFDKAEWRNRYPGSNVFLVNN